MASADGVRGVRDPRRHGHSPSLPEELRLWSCNQHGPRDGADELMQRPSLLAQRGGCRLHPSDELTAPLALTSEARLPMNDHRSNRSLRDVVGRLDASHGHERPHRGLSLQDAATLARRFVPRTSRASVEKREHPRTKRRRPSSQICAFDVAALVQVSEPEHFADQSQEPLSDPSQLFLAFRHSAEVPNEVSEAHPVGVKVVVALTDEVRRQGSAAWGL